MRKTLNSLTLSEAAHIEFRALVQNVDLDHSASNLILSITLSHTCVESVQKHINRQTQDCEDPTGCM